MTSNDAPTPPAGRRRPLGRGPGAAPPPPAGNRGAGAPEADVAAEPDAPPEAGPATAPRTTAEPAPDARADAPRPDPGSAPAGLPDPERTAREPVVRPPDRKPDAGAVAGPGERAERHGAAEPRAAGRAREPRAESVARGTGARPPSVPEGGAVGVRPKSPGALAEDGPAAPPGAAGAGRAGEADGATVFKVRLANFEGPFDLLLQLISRHKLDVTEVALSKVTDEFMAHIRTMGPDWDLDETTEFLVVAATLLDLKAARLLPAAEVEDEADLALLEARDLLFARLLQYRAYKQIAEIFNRRLDGEARRLPRTVGLEPHHAELLPEVVLGIGPDRFAQLAVRAMQPRPKPQVYVDHIHAPLVSVQEQARFVVARLRELGEASFRTLVEDTGDTLTVVARFLALLELYREKAVALDQETALGDLTVRWTGGDGEGTPTVTDEFDRPPGEPREPPGEPREPAGKPQASQEETV
jgi:segregation and condensation protein A